MKKISFCIISVICCFAFFSCNLLPQTAVVTIKNSSGSEVRNITLSYEHASKNQMQTVKIERLANNESRPFELELTSPSPAIGAGVATVFGEIEYWIDGKKFGMSDGNREINLGDGARELITINEKGWRVTRER